MDVPAAVLLGRIEIPLVNRESVDVFVVSKDVRRAVGQARDGGRLPVGIVGARADSYGPSDRFGGAELERAATLLDMAQRLERELAQLNRLGESARLYEETVLPRARETAESVLLAYQNENADFAELVRSELAHLDAELALLRIEVDMLLAQSRILYLTGDIQ